MLGATAPSLEITLALTGLIVGAAAVPIARRSMTRRRRIQPALVIVSSLATAALFAVIGWRVGATPPLAGYLAFAAAAVALSIVDLAEQRLPNALVLPATAVVAALLLLAALLEGSVIPAAGVVLGGAALFVVYLILAVPLRGALGMGDVKLALLVGAAGGFLGARAWFITLVAGFLVNGVAALVALAARRTTLRGSIPFGPSMLAGVVVALLLA